MSAQRQHVRRSSGDSDPLSPNDRHQLPARLLLLRSAVLPACSADWLRHYVVGYAWGLTGPQVTAKADKTEDNRGLFGISALRLISSCVPCHSCHSVTPAFRPKGILIGLHVTLLTSLASACAAYLISPSHLNCSAYVVICACICCCWCAYSPCPDLASTVVAVWRAAPLLPSVTRVVRSSVRLTCAFSRSSSRGPLSSPPAVAAAACLLAAVAAADDDVLPSVLMEVPLLMSLLQPSHLLELGDDEARRTSGS